jgi:hypothetical protein
MKKIENGIAILFDEMLKLGLISTGSFWIEKGIANKNTRLPVGIANSKLLIYDQIDRKVLYQGNLN